MNKIASGKMALVTAEAVFAAADALATENKIPTIRAVRAKIGGGSFGTILPFLQSWHRAQEEKKIVAAQSNAPPILPPAVAATLDQLIIGVAAVAQSVVQAQDAVRRDAAADFAVRLRTLTTAHQDSPPTAERLQQQVAELQQMASEKIAQLRAERDQLANELAEANRKIAALRTWCQDRKTRVE